jgi:DNA-binding NarL/FixJ family response regulator
MNSHGVIRVLSVDNHCLFQQGVASVIDEQTDMRMVARASSGTEASRQYREHLPDVTLMDLRLPGLSGIDSLMAIREEFPGARVIILTTLDGDSEVQHALRAGARGYLLKSVAPRDLVAAIREVHAGGKRIQPEVLAQIAEHMGEENLTAREIEVLRLVVTGHRNRDIGGQLYISEETVKVHLRHIREKLGARDRTHAVTLAERRGIIRLDSERASMTARWEERRNPGFAVA